MFQRTGGVSYKLKNLKLLRISLILIAVGLLIFLILYSRGAISIADNFFRGFRAATYSKLSFIGTFVSEIKKNKALIEENIQLQEEIDGLLARLAWEEDLKEQNDFLRQALGLSVISGRLSTDAGIFSNHFTPEGHYILINKGAENSIKKGDIVISSSGALVGIVDEVFNNYSRVASVMSKDFKATIQVMSKDISGIAQGAMEEGINLDFISQNDEIAEGDIVSTSGNDIFPAGLIVGKVIKVGDTDGGLFKDVVVEPVIKQVNLSQVLVLTKD